VKVVYTSDPNPHYPISNKEKELVLDNLYNVPCLEVRVFETGKLVMAPVFGPPHIDGPEVMQDEVTAGKCHIHIDYRFLTLYEITQFDRQSSIILKVNEEPLIETTGLNLNLIWQVRRYVRKWNPYPTPTSLQNKFAGCRLSLNTKICPHQGFDLTTIDPVERNGKMVRICPGHSLAWCEKTGEQIIH
jgi:hypothetical protein